MSQDANKAIVQRFIHEMLDQGNAAVEAELFTEDCVRHFPGNTITGYGGTPTGPQRVTSFRTTIHDLIAEGDRVVIRLTHEVTYAADLANFPRVGRVGAAGKATSWDAIAMFRFRDGRIAEEWVSRDELGMLLRLGATVTAPAAQ